MIILYPNIETNNVILRKPIVNDSASYTILFQHCQNRIAFIQEFEDNVKGNSNWFQFDLKFPDEMPYGEYEYYIFDISGFSSYDINIENVKQTCFYEVDGIRIYNFDYILKNFDFFITNGDDPDKECIRPRLLDYGMLQRFNFEEYKSYVNPKTFISYDKTRK